MSGVLVSKDVCPEEKCIRCVYHPLMIKTNGRLKREALLPPHNRKDVSLLRLKYTDENFCINHGKKTTLNNQIFYGLASFFVESVIDCNQWANATNNMIKAEVKYSPISNGVYISKKDDVYTEDDSIDLPMHADLFYNIENNNEEGEPRTQLRAYATELVKKVNFKHIDDFLDH